VILLTITLFRVPKGNGRFQHISPVHLHLKYIVRSGCVHF